MTIESLIDHIREGDFPLFSKELHQYLAVPGHTIDDKDFYGRSFLLEAVSKGHIDIVKLVVEKGASFNVTSKAGETLLMVAAEKGYLNLIQYLLEQNVSIYETERVGGENVLTHLLSIPPSERPSNYLTIREFLVKKGGKKLIDAQQGFYKMTALMHVAKMGSTEDIYFLLAHGADFNLDSEKTPLPPCVVSIVGDCLYQDTVLLSAFYKAISFSRPSSDESNSRKTKREPDVSEQINKKRLISGT